MGPVKVILAGNMAQAGEYVRAQGWNPRECVVVGTPDRLRGIRGPIEVHRVGTYWTTRSAGYIEAAEQNVAIIEATSP